MAECDPAIVLNSAAYNQVDVAEKEPQAAFSVNGLAVRNLAVACRQADARLVHFSTDYVFDGMAGRAYTEQDTPRPLGAYAVSKLAGEYYARAYLDQALIIRTSSSTEPKMSSRLGRGPVGIRPAGLNRPSTIRAAITIVTNISAVIRSANEVP